MNTKRHPFRIHHPTVGVYASFQTLYEATQSLASPDLIRPTDYTIRLVLNRRRVATYDRHGRTIS